LTARLSTSSERLERKIITIDKQLSIDASR
jgi:hypothetical protein